VRHELQFTTFSGTQHQPMRIQPDRGAVVIDRYMADSNSGHGGVRLLEAIQINTLCARQACRRGGPEYVAKSKTFPFFGLETQLGCQSHDDRSGRANLDNFKSNFGHKVRLWMAEQAGVFDREAISSRHPTRAHTPAFKTKVAATAVSNQDQTGIDNLAVQSSSIFQPPCACFSTKISRPVV
jgi:hypothetical protein